MYVSIHNHPTVESASNSHEPIPPQSSRPVNATEILAPIASNNECSAYKSPRRSPTSRQSVVPPSGNPIIQVPDQLPDDPAPPIIIVSEAFALRTIANSHNVRSCIGIGLGTPHPIRPCSLWGIRLYTTVTRVQWNTDRLQFNSVGGVICFLKLSIRVASPRIAHRPKRQRSLLSPAPQTDVGPGNFSPPRSV